MLQLLYDSGEALGRSFGVPQKLEELPESLDVWRPLVQAREFLQNYGDMDAFWANRWKTKENKAADQGDAADAGESMPAKPEKQKLPWQSDRRCVQSALNQDTLARVLAAVATAAPNLPKEAAHYVKMVLIARGVMKALTVRQALDRYCAALEQVAAEVEPVRTALRNLLDGSEA